MTMVKALVVGVGLTPPVVVEIEPTAEVIHKLVGGWLEIVTPSVANPDAPRWHAYCDKDGKGRNSIVNVWASELAYRLGWPPNDFLVGPVVFLGNGANGHEADVPQEVVDLFFKMIGTGSW